MVKLSWDIHLGTTLFLGIHILGGHYGSEHPLAGVVPGQSHLDRHDGPGDSGAVAAPAGDGGWAPAPALPRGRASPKYV